MKRTLSMALVLGLITATAFAAEVTSVNTVGYKEITVPANGYFRLTGFQFGGLSSLSIDEVLDPSQLQAAGGAFDPIEAADRLFIYNGSTYDQYGLRPGGWVAAADWLSQTPATVNILQGDALFLKSYDGAPTDRTITVAGEVLAEATFGPVTIPNTGFQLLAYPYAATRAINDLDFINDGATSAGGAFDPIEAADNLYVWDQALNSGAGGYKVYGLRPTGWVASTDWLSQTLTTDTVAIGEGFFYLAKTQFDWTESKPY